MSVRITDSAGALVAEFTGPDTEAEKLISFWRGKLPGEELTVQRGKFSADPPERWSAKATKVYECQAEAGR